MTALTWAAAVAIGLIALGALLALTAWVAGTVRRLLWARRNLPTSRRSTR